METKSSETDKVDTYMATFEHPLKEAMIMLRQIIVSADASIGEEVKWNAPTFFYTGPMEPSDPKLFERYLIVSNVHARDHIMLVWPHGDKVDNGSGFFEGTYADGRRLLRFYSVDEVKAKKHELQEAIRSWLHTVKK